MKYLAALTMTISGAVSFEQWPQLTTQDTAILGSRSFQGFFDSPQATSIRQCSRYYTNGSHFLGQGHLQAEWTQARWDEFGIPQTQINSYSATLNYPGSSELTLLNRGGKDEVVLYEASLKEDNAPSSGDGQPPFLSAFLAGAPAGNITAQYVYVNFGLQPDYNDLARANISVQGNIVIAKTVFGSSLLQHFNLSTNRITQMHTAFKMGAAGLILYTDPQLDGNITEANGYLPFPDGPARPPSMIERGSANIGGKAIPAIPISYADAIPILRALNGHGPVSDSFGERWAGGGLMASGVQYNIGPSPPNLLLHMYTNPKRINGTIYNTIGKISGRRVPDEIIILGAHRDSWGPGAGDAVSGICALSEVARILGAALQRGWTPRRTIMLASWEGEELGALGSKAWLKDNISSLNSSLVAYLNVVVAGAGSKFHAVGSPLLTNVLHLASESAPLPGQNVDYWDGTIATGSGGDANVFQSSYCFSTLDFGFTSKPGDPVFPYHSLFDSEDWMDRFGDPDREYHKVIVKLWLSLASLLADSLILPILAADYAKSMKDMVKEIRMRATSTSKLDLGPLETAIESFHKACAVHDAYSHSLTPLSSQKLPKKSVLNQIREVNHKYIMLERFFADPEKTSQEGNRNLVLPTGSYYIKRPGFPQLTQLIEQNNWPEARAHVHKIVGQIERATNFLNPSV